MMKYIKRNNDYFILFVFILLVIVAINIISCRNEYHKQDQIIYDSKWMMYALNYENPAKPTFFDNKSLGLKNVVECEYEVAEISQYNDTTLISFKLYYMFDTILYRVNHFSYVGLLIVSNEIVYPIPDEVKPDFLNNSDSCKAFLFNQRNKFETFIKTYKGKMVPWLEMERRNRGLY